MNMTEESVFAEALAKPNVQERAAFLDRVCAGRNGLRQSVESLLSAYNAGEFLEAAAPGLHGTGDVSPLLEKPGTVIGPYKLLQQIGEGGMGVVYMAEQQEPVRRKVALKIIKPGMDSQQVIARFEAERQALAMMDHQNIAKVLGAGATESGRPYFVMELVHGVPITQYGDDHKLTPRQRLDLFIPVCQAVQHAHQKGIIHRDLKPSNILVTMYDDRPVPKVIDFGVAKAVEQRLTEKTLFTQFGTLVGTFEYMSPEQAEMNAFGVDTRSDIYSLGVLLYELLTGSTPLERQRLREAAYGEIVRLIREEQPPRPSTRLSSSGAALAAISQQRGSAPETLTRLVRGELDWIVMRCLEKDRTRRYETANGLARDVERYLKDEPVEACPPTAGYKLRKFARKHHKLLTTAAAFAALLLLGVAGSAWQAVRATEAEAKANANAGQAQDKEQEANQQRDEAQKQRDEVKALNEKLRATQEQLRHTLYAAHLHLAQRNWEEAAILQALVLLNQHRLEPGGSDLRGFEWHYLNRLCHADEPDLTLKGGGRFSSLTYSPDGKHLIGVSGAGFGGRRGEDAKRVDPVMTVWDAQTGKELHTLTLKGGGRQVTLSLDGKRLASSSDVDQTLKVWDAETGKELLSIEGAGSKVYGGGHVVFSPDGKRMLSGGKVWDAETGKKLFTVNAGGDGVVFSPDGKHLAASDSKWNEQGKVVSAQVTVCDAQTGMELFTLKGHADWVQTMAFSPDGKHLMTHGGRRVSVWSVETGKELFGIQEADGIAAAVLSPDGKHLAIAEENDSAPRIKVWDAHTGKAVVTFHGHTSWVTKLVFSPDGQRLASHSNDHTLRIWDLQTGKAVRTVKGQDDGRNLIFSPNGKRVAVNGFASVNFWDVQKEQQESHTLTLNGVSGPGALWLGATWVVFSPDLEQVAGVSAKSVKVWDARTGKEIYTLEGHSNRASCVAFSADGKRLASGDGASFASSRPGAKAVAGEVKIWDARIGKELLSLKGHTHGVCQVTFSTDGKRLASVAEDHTIKVWDAETGKELLSVTSKAPQFSPLVKVAFSPDRKRLASGGKIWDAQTGKELLSLPPPAGGPGGSLVFSPNGKRLASGWKVWDAETGKELLDLKVGGGSVVFSPDGKRLATVGDRQVKLWDAQTGEETFSLKNPAPFSSVLAFSADGHRLGIVSPDGAVTRWDATPLPEKP